MSRRRLNFARVFRAAAVGLVTVAVSLSVVMAGPAAMFHVPDAAAKCYADPASQFTWSDGEFTVDIFVDLELNTAKTLPANQGAAVDQIVEFPAEAVEAVDAFFGDIANWYFAPCSELLAAEGALFASGVPVPRSPQAPYGFGGVDAKAAIPMVIEVSTPEPAPATAADRGNEVVVDGVHLAKSGSETAVIVYFGAGLVAFGAAALGMRRRL